MEGSKADAGSKMSATPGVPADRAPNVAANELWGQRGRSSAKRVVWEDYFGAKSAWQASSTHCSS